MYSRTTAAFVFLGAFQAAQATVSLGSYNGDSVAWIAGQVPCTQGFTVIAPSSENPCNIPFTLDNGVTYTVQNCGTNQFALYNSDGSFNSDCIADTAYSCQDDGTISQTWTCP